MVVNMIRHSLSLSHATSLGQWAPSRKSARKIALFAGLGVAVTLAYTLLIGGGSKNEMVEDDHYLGDGPELAEYLTFREAGLSLRLPPEWVVDQQSPTEYTLKGTVDVKTPHAKLRSKMVPASIEVKSGVWLKDGSKHQNVSSASVKESMKIDTLRRLQDKYHCRPLVTHDYEVSLGEFSHCVKFFLRTPAVVLEAISLTAFHDGNLCSLVLVDTPVVVRAAQAVFTAIARSAITGFGLVDAAGRGDTARCKLLLARGVGASVREIPNGISPLFFAIEKQYSSICELLLAHGADANQDGHRGTLPLAEAATNGDMRICALLVGWGAKVDDSLDRWSPLAAAAAYCHPDIVAFLLGCCANINRTETDGRTALSSAAAMGKVTCRQLVEWGANVTHAEHDGATPILLAARSQHIKVSTYLFQCGALDDNTIAV